ncbi:MAG: hypothetical protein HYV14_10650 [Elusimicrobia bacterium]|nr:hypothetical protein [Elusimicrobiota bacterium]
MKRFLDDLLGRQPAPNRSNGFFPIGPMPQALLRCRQGRKAAMNPQPKRPVTRRRPQNPV